MSISGLAGTSWPWKEFPRQIEDLEVVAQAIEDIIFTGLKARKMNLTHGSQVMSLVFANKGVLLTTLASREVSIALAQHLPEVEVVNVDVDEGEKDTDPVTITVTYRYQGIYGSVDVDVPVV